MTEERTAAGRLQIDSITGVPLELPIAGPGGRSFAFIIDWHIRTLTAAAWLFAFTFVMRNYSDAGDTVPGWVIVLGILPPAALYLLYHPVLEIVMAGRTPGKRMAGIRIVTVEGSVPGTGAIVVRNLFRFVDGLPFVYVVGLVFTIVTERHQRIGDLAAGTLLVYEDADKSETLGGLPRAGAASGISTADAELVQDLIDRWPTLDPEYRLDLARRLLARLDPADAQSRQALLNDGNAVGALQHWLGGIR